MALSATAEFYEPEECATKIIPSISHLLIDKEKYAPDPRKPFYWLWLTACRIVRVQATKTMETFLQRITKLTASMPDTALPIPAETPRSLTPNTPSQPSESLAYTATSALAGWAISGLKKGVLGSESSNGDIRPDSAPPILPTHRRETPVALKGLGSNGDVDAWKDDVFDDHWGKPRGRQQSAPVSLGMKLPSKNKKSIVEKVVEEEERKSVDAEEDGAGAWPGLDDWEDDGGEVDGWGFDDEV
jgi:hypothetical protein